MDKGQPAAGELTSTQRLARRVAALRPSGIRKFFDIAATMNDVVSLGPRQEARISAISIL